MSELAANGRLDDNVYYIWLHRSALQCRMSLLEWTNFVQFFCYRHLGGRLFLVIYSNTATSEVYCLRVPCFLTVDENRLVVSGFRGGC